MASPDRVVWLDVLSHLRKTQPDACRQWFDDLIPVSSDGGVFRVRVDQPVHQRYLQKQCAPLFNEALQIVTGRLLTVRFIGMDEEAPAARANGHNGHGASAPAAGEAHGPLATIGPGMAATLSAGVAGATPASMVERRPIRPGDYHHDSLLISPDHTFENFVIGPENRLAHAAAQAVALQPGVAYNPLFIHGGVGLGKTHLLQAICLRILESRRDAHILYVSCDGFMTQFFEAVRLGQMADFRHRFRDVDVLVIDDIHFLTKREQTQEEFFHTFNALHQANRQIVLSSDAAPSDIPDLEARLVSRFQSGMVGQVSQPGFETRVQIVKQKARIRGVQISEDVACLVAARAPSNVRELEGAVSRIQMQSVADQAPITLELARRALEGLVATPRPEVTITAIIDAVVDYYGVKLTDLQSKRRQKSIAHPRQVCMYLIRTMTRYSLEEIGGYFGGRDHTTVMHAVRAVTERRQSDTTVERALVSIERRLKPADVV